MNGKRSFQQAHSDVGCWPQARAAGHADIKKTAHTTDGRKGHPMNILDHLPLGEDNAITSRALANLCGYGTIRELQQDIERLRINGHVICSKGRDGGGYYYHANEAELRAFYSTTHSRAVNTLRSLKSARQALQAFESKNE